MVLLKEVNGTQQTHQIKFAKVMFWIIFHDLLLMAKNVYMGRLIGNNFNEVMKVDVDENELPWEII